jgi:hypothetical protein
MGLESFCIVYIENTMSFFSGFGTRTNKIAKGTYRGLGNFTKRLGKGLGLRTDGKFMMLYKQIKENENNPEMLTQIRSKIEELYNTNKQSFVNNGATRYINYGMPKGNYYNATFMEKPKILMVYIDYLLSGIPPSVVILNKIREQEGQISALVVRNIEQKENSKLAQNSNISTGGRRSKKTRKYRR